MLVLFNFKEAFIGAGRLMPNSCFEGGGALIGERRLSESGSFTVHNK